MDRNIFEHRTLQGMEGGLAVSTNVGDCGGFYALSIHPAEYSKLTFEADNVQWIAKVLYPALQAWLYEAEEFPLTEEFAEVRELSRVDLVSLFEMLTVAATLGWFIEKEGDLANRID